MFHRGIRIARNSPTMPYEMVLVRKKQKFAHFSLGEIWESPFRKVQHCSLRLGEFECKVDGHPINDYDLLARLRK